MSYAIPIHVLSMSYVCLVVLFRTANEIQLEIALLFEFSIPRHSVHQAQQDLLAAAARADSSFAPCLVWGRRWRGLLPAGAGAGSSAGSAGGKSAGVWGFLGVCNSARALGAGTMLAPATSSTPSQYALLRSGGKEVEFGAKTHSGRSMPTISLQQRSTSVTDSVRIDMSVI